MALPENKQTENKGLERRLGFFPVSNIVIANMIGAGIFTTSGLLLADLHNPVLMLILWMAGGIIALCGALSYGELGANMPEAGGEYLYLSRLYTPLTGFLSGWISFVVGFSAPIAASAIGFSVYITRAFPGFPDQMFQFTAISQPVLEKAMAVAVIILFTVIHYRGLKLGATVQNYLTVLKIVLITGFIVIGFAAGNGNLAHFYAHEESAAGFAGWKTVGLSLMWIMFAYSGWNASSYIGSEIKNPKRNLPLSLLFGTMIVMILYLLVNFVFIYAIHPEEMKGVISVGGLAMENMFGRTGGAITSVLIAFALFSSLSAFMIIGPRVYYSMAKDGLFFKSAARIHPKFNVPSTSIVFQSVIAIVVTITGTFDQILTYMGFALSIFPLLAVAGVIKLRMQGTNTFKMPGYPVPQIIYLLTGVFILVLAFLERPFESSMSILTVLAGIPVFFLMKRKT